MARSSLLLLPILSLPLALACGDKEVDDTGGSAGDGGSEDDCTLDLAPAGDVESDATCEAVVDKLVGMEVAWQWTGTKEYPTYNSVHSTPVVGDVDLDGVPEIVFTTTDPAYMWYGGLLLVIDGITGETELMLDGFGDTLISDLGSPAIADITGDGVPEILFITVDGTIGAVDAEGNELFETAASGTIQPYGQLGVADFDGDGLGEIYGGSSIFGSDGGYIEGGDYGAGVTNSPAVADMDGDGDLDLVVGAMAFDAEGNMLYDASKEVPDIAPAVADFDGDGKGEVVGTDYSYSGVWFLDDDGTLLWAQVLPGYYGGPPCVADFDGDSEPEIVVAGFYSASMMEADGTVVWTTDIIDGGYGTNGCSAFDFEDDGQYELILADDDAIMIIDGATGDVLLEDTAHAGSSINHQPVVADLDGNGYAELIVGSNQANDSSGWAGITVLKDTYDTWSPTRPVWNQSGFYGANVDDDLGLPTSAVSPWDDGDNNFRANTVYDRGEPMAPAANLVGLASDVCVTCNSGLIKFEVAVQVANQGAVDVEEPIAVGVYAVTAEGRRELVNVATIDDGLAAGRSSDSFEVSGQFATAVGFTHMEVQVGGNEVRLDAGLSSHYTYLDCDDSDNIAIIEFGCDE